LRCGETTAVQQQWETEVVDEEDVVVVVEVADVVVD
jgi:hypothetical protein